MKVFLEVNKIKQENFDIIKNKFKNVEFVSDVDNSYDCDVLVVEPSYIQEENIKKYNNLKWVQSYRAGFDNSDLNSLRKRNIVFTNAKDVYSISIAEDVLTKILVMNRDVKTYLKNMEEGLWKPKFIAPEIYKSTIGIIGTGSIAKEIAKRIKSFDTHIIGFRRSIGKEDYFDQILTGDDGLNHLLKESDYVILTVPLNEGTKGMINFEKIKLMKPTSLLINIARGEVIVQEDLIRALKENVIRGAALDVVIPEPLPKDHELWKLENVYITPHCSAASPNIQTRIKELLIENFTRYIEGKELLNIQ